MSKEIMGEFSGSDKTTTPLRRVRRFGAVLLATVSLVPVNAYNDIHLDPSTYALSIPFDQDSGLPAKKSTTNICDTPSASDLGAVKQLFKRPENPRINDIIYGDNGEPTSVGFARMRKEVAEKYYLTVHDFDSEYPEFKQDVESNGGAKLPFTEYLAKTKEFAKKYGVDITIKDPSSPEGSVRSVGYVLDELEDKRAKLSMYELAQSLSQIPVEWVTYMDVKNVVLTKVQDPRYSGYADTDEGHTMYVDPHKMPPNIFHHESFHLWDAKKCGREGMYNDNAYTAYNPAERIYKLPDNHEAPAVVSHKYIERSSFDNFKTDIEYEILLAKEDHDREAIKELRKLVIEHGLAVTALTDYSFGNEVEDKATEGEVIPDTFDQRTVIDPLTPILQSKAEELLARIYEDHPRLVGYISEIGMRAR